MSARHPIIAVTGSSGAGTTTVKDVFAALFQREHIKAAIVEGDGFHRYTRAEMQRLIIAMEARGERGISHFAPEANLIDELEQLFRGYAATGTGRRRTYIHSDELAARWNLPVGTFSAWEALPAPTDCLFYEGLHGALVTDSVDLARHPDLLIGVAPTINLEWLQKLHRDTHVRGYSTEAVQDTILRRMHDYVHYIVPQFSRTHINFQRVPVVDTSNPFSADDVPNLNESMVVIRFREPHQINTSALLKLIDGAFMSRPDTLVISGNKLEHAMQLILTPLIEQLIARKHRV